MLRGRLLDAYTVDTSMFTVISAQDTYSFLRHKLPVFWTRNVDLFSMCSITYLSDHQRGCAITSEMMRRIASNVCFLSPTHSSSGLQA